MELASLTTPDQPLDLSEMGSENLPGNFTSTGEMVMKLARSAQPLEQLFPCPAYSENVSGFTKRSLPAHGCPGGSGPFRNPRPYKRFPGASLSSFSRHEKL
jgi:hypothetical protein